MNKNIFKQIVDGRWNIARKNLSTNYYLQSTNAGYTLIRTLRRKDRINSIHSGYSLIEIMVVLTLFSLLVLVATQTLMVSLRTASKSESIGKVKENLEFAVNVMERQLRSAKSVVDTCPLSPAIDSTPLSLTYLDQNGVEASFACQNIGVDGYVASGSATLIGSGVGAARLTNQSVSITSCSITCSANTGAPTSITISLTAEDKSSLPGAERAAATSQTTVSLRQY